MTTIAADKQENSLGIPKAIFLEDVDKFMKDENKNAEDVIKKLDELYQKYRLMEINLLQKKEKLKNQIPDIKMSLGESISESIHLISLFCWLDMVLLIKRNDQEKKTIITDFILSHNLYSKAEVEPTDRVCLWLGANVMLEYTNREAEELLTKNLTQATASMDQTQIDLDFLKFLFLFS